MQRDTVISERPIPINDAARRDMDRERFLSRRWIEVTPGMREAGITEYPPKHLTGDYRPIGMRNMRDTPDGGAA